MDKILTTMPHLSNVCITDIDWQKFLRSLPPKKASSPLFESIREEFPDTEEASEGRLLDMILKAKSRDRQREILREFISRWLAGWIGGSAEEIDMNVPLFTYGIDSVGASALKGEIEKQVDIDFEV